MKINLDPKALAAVVANSVAARNSTLAIYTHLHLATSKNCLFITSNNSEQELRERIPAQVEAAGEATMEADKLKHALAGLGGQIRIEHNQGASILSQGRRRFRFPSEKADDFPGMDPGEQPLQPVDVDTTALADALDTVFYAAARDDVRYYLCAVRLMGDRVVATDGKRLACVEMEADLPDCLLPRAAVPVISKALRRDGATLSIGRVLQVEAPDFRLRTVLVDGMKPDYERILRSNACTASMLCSGPDVARAIDRLMPFATVKGAAYNPVRIIKGSDDLAILETIQNDTANQDEIPARFDGDDWPEQGVALDVRFLRDAAQACAGPLQWRVPPTTGQMFLDPANDPKTTHSIMPVRT